MKKTKVRYGKKEEQFYNLVGKKIADIRKFLAAPYNSPACIVFANNTEVNDNYVIENNCNLEFFRVEELSFS